MSSLPNVSTACTTISCAACQFDTSDVLTTALPPRRSISETTSCAGVDLARRLTTMIQDR